MIPPVLVERADTRPIYLPVEEASPFPWRKAIGTGAVGFVAVALFIVGLVVIR